MRAPGPSPSSSPQVNRGARIRADLSNDSESYVPQRAEQHVGRRVVTEGRAQMHEAVDVAGSEDKAAAELERMLAEAVLPMAAGTCAVSRREVIGANEV